MPAPESAPATSKGLPALEIPQRPDLAKDILQPYPTQPAIPANGARLPTHPVNSYQLDETQRSLELELLAPERIAEGWYLELSVERRLIWQHSGDIADARGIVKLELPAQRLKDGRYALEVRRQLDPSSRSYLYLFDIELARTKETGH